MPQSTSNPAADDIVDCTDIQALVGKDRLTSMGMSCSDGNWPNWQGSARSCHPNGIQSVFCDGSVHWINNDVETKKPGVSSVSTVAD
ncbi:MAG: DUF1559 domain-containing protein, partial [Alphaproteobacteria bacterium]|nr:DUF1559 domain-containing protein [Alphaproteobacteria bacterium]